MTVGDSFAVEPDPSGGATWLQTAASIVGSLSAMSPGGDDNHDALANVTSTVEQDRWVLIVDEVILLATIVGSCMILGSMAWMEFKGRPSTTRMRIVQSLVVSDLSLGIVGAIGVSKALSKGGLHPGQLCDGLGTLLVATIWSEHMWTLSLAFATFMILIHPLHVITLWLERRWYILWIGVWVLSFALSVMGYELYGYSPSGGICYYPASSGLFADLIQFIPRGTVFVIVTVLYVRLFVFLRRPDRIRSPYSDSPTNNNSYLNERRTSPFGLTAMKRRTGLGKLLLGQRRDSRQRQEYSKEGFEVAPDSGEHHDPTPNQRPTPPFTPDSEIPPWEKIDLPVFQVDGQRYGGASANLPVSGSAGWNWKMGSKHQTQAQRIQRGSLTPSTPPLTGQRKFGSMSTEGGSDHQMVSLTTPPEKEYGRRSSYGFPQQYHRTHLDQSTIGQTLDVTTSGSNMELGPIFDTDARRGSSNTQTSMSNSNQSAQTDGSPTYPPSTSQQPQPSLSDRRSSNETGKEAIQTPDLHEDLRGEYILPSREVGEEELGEEEIDDDEDELDLMRVLKTTAPPKSQEDDRFAPASGEVVLVEESMASYLNRKTALLMLWFPLGYILLFSVSLIRIIYDFVGRPPVVLRALSRWFIFAQGILDALIYGLVEWHTKRVVRRKVKKIQSSPNGSTNPGDHATHSWQNAIISPRKSPPKSPRTQSTAKIQSQIHSISSQHTSTQPLSGTLNARLGQERGRGETTSYGTDHTDQTVKMQSTRRPSTATNLEHDEDHRLERSILAELVPEPTRKMPTTSSGGLGKGH